MAGLMQPGPTLYEAEQQRKKKGSRGLLGEVGEPLSYAPGPLGLLGNAMLSAQYATGEKPMDEGLSALAMLTGLMQGTKVAPIMRNAIKVYHGSPHKFDKADSSKIGTGEGAQAYGHGLYWAEKPEVAQDYALNLSQRLPDRIKYNDKALAPNTMLARAMEDVGLVGKDAALQKLDDSIKFNEKYSPDTANLYKSIREIIKDADPAKVDVNKGNLYEASLRWPDPAREAADPLSAKHFLDWDKPLSEQPEAVRNLLGNVDPNNRIRTGLAFDRWKTQGSLSPEVASQKLRDLGIPGITYLDAGSRAAGEGTRNYVTFDDALVELLKRNGMGLLGK